MGGAVNRAALIASVFIASYESPRVLVRWWWRRSSEGELARGRHFLSVTTEREPFYLVTTIEHGQAQAAFDRMVREAEEEFAQVAR